MPFLFKQTMIFEGPGHGWTESVYFQRATDDVQAAIDFTLDYRNKRRPLLGAQCSIIGQRTVIVQDDTGAPVRRVGLPNTFGQVLTGTQAQDSEDTGTSLEVMWSDPTSKYKKIMYLGGVWASIFPRANVYVPAGAWTGFFNSWVTACKTLGFGWRRRIIANSYQISNYTTDAASGITTYTIKSAASVLADFGDKRTVSVEFFNDRNALDGVQVVVPVSEAAPVAPETKWTTTLKTAKPRPSKAFTTPGQMRLFSSAFVTPQAAVAQGPEGSINPIRPVGRKRGRPLLVSAGRLPNRVRF